MAVDLEEYKRRRRAGLSPQDAMDNSEEPAGFSIGRTIANIPGSAANFAGGLLSAVAHPIRTAKAIGSVAAGGVEKLIPGKQAEEASFDQLIGFYKQRYGSVDTFLKTLEDDPVGVLADASTAISAGGAAVRIAGNAARASSVANAGQKIATIGAKANPISLAGKAVSPVVDKAFPWVSRTLEKANLRLTPAQKRELGGKVNEITDFLSKKIEFGDESGRLVGTPQQRFDKATAMYEAAETTLDKFFGQIAEGHGLRKDSVVRGLQSIKGFYKNDRDSAVINRQIDSAIAAIKKNQTDIIPYKNLNDFKRSTYKNAYNRAGDKVLDDVEHAIGDVVRSQLEEGLKGLKIGGRSFEDFNRQYGLLIQGRKLLKASIGRPELSPVTERILGSLIGFGVGQGPGALLGAALGRQAFEALPITAARSAAGAGARLLSGIKVPAPVKRALPYGTAAERITESQQDQ